MKTTAVGLFIAAIAACAAWYCHDRVTQLSGVPVRSAAAVADARYGTLVLVYGGVWAGSGDGLRVFVNETEICRTRTTTNSDGKTTTSTSCHWNETGRTTPPFDVIFDGVPVHVSNGDYRLTGPNRYITTGWRTRLRGFANGDGVLVVGATTPNGIQATEVYGGTRDQYIGGYAVWFWVWVVAALICGIGGVILGIFDS